MRERPGALFTKLLRIGVWSKITGQLAMKPSLSLRTVVTERKTKERRDQSHSEGGRERKREKQCSNIWFMTGSRGRKRTNMAEEV